MASGAIKSGSRAAVLRRSEGTRSSSPSDDKVGGYKARSARSEPWRAEQSSTVQPVTRLRNVAVILAGGTGTRVGLNIPKQLIKVAGKPIIEHTIAAMHQSPLVDEIVVMMAPGYLDEIRAIVKKGEYVKVSQILEGAETRNETTAAALAALGDEECNVLLHDAVRPLVSQTIIAANVDALQSYEAVDTAIPSADTVIQVLPEHNSIADVLPRHLLRRGQTPQSFRLSTIKAAYAKAAQDPNFTATDDCTVVLRYLPEVPIAVVAGHERNMKVTEPIDVYIADKLFQLTSADRPTPLTEAQYREKLDGRTVVVFGGSYGIGGDIAELARKYGANVKTSRDRRPVPMSKSEPTSPRLPSRCSTRLVASITSSMLPVCWYAVNWPRHQRK
jgi:2-C-methyl-D-erythritol 4-phosphate cytidylyltransferase